MRIDDESRCYLNHLVAQHRRLHAALRDMRQSLLAGPDATPSLADVAGKLQRLRGEVAAHFAEEEAGGCLDEAVSQCPSLSANARRIEREHPRILQRIDRLLEKSSNLSPTKPNLALIQGEFNELTLDLEAHEAAENHLLAQAFGKAVNGEDDDLVAVNGTEGAAR